MQIKDCNVVASKLILILDDLLWVLTDSQLKAMVQYAKSLSEVMEKSAQQRKTMATEDQVSDADIHRCVHLCIKVELCHCHCLSVWFINTFTYKLYTNTLYTNSQPPMPTIDWNDVPSAGILRYCKIA